MFYVTQLLTSVLLFAISVKHVPGNFPSLHIFFPIFFVLLASFVSKLETNNNSAFFRLSLSLLCSLKSLYFQLFEKPTKDDDAPATRNRREPTWAKKPDWQYVKLYHYHYYYFYFESRTRMKGNYFYLKIRIIMLARCNFHSHSESAISESIKFKWKQQRASTKNNNI